MELLILQLYPSSCYFICPSSKYSLISFTSNTLNFDPCSVYVLYEGERPKFTQEETLQLCIF
jgi:hypothetical protein